MEYLVQQPNILENLAINEIRDWILFQGKRISELQLHNAAKAEELITQQIEITRNYLKCRLPSKFYDKLANVLTMSLNVIERSSEFKFGQKILIGRMIETVFSKNLTCLSLCSEMFFASLSKSFLLPAVVDLTFSPYRWSGEVVDIEIVTVQFLKELHNLKYLNLSYCSGISSINNILSCIAENCKLVEVLNLCYLECFNDDSIDILARLKNLRKVILCQTAVSELGIEALLLSCENIEYIAIDENEIALALENIVEDHTAKEFKLIFYENCRETTAEQFQLIIKMCPKIQKIKLTKYETAENYLLALNNAKCLRKLELYGYEFYADQVKEVLQERGCSLVHLHLEDVEQIDLDALMFISTTCPNLETLSLEDCLFVNQLPNNLPHYTKPTETLSLRNLKRLYLTRWGNQQATQLSEEQLLFLLSSCPNIELIFTSLVPLKDDVILKVLDINPWIRLEELILRHQDRPSVVVIDRLVQNCINLTQISTCESFTNRSARRYSINHGVNT